MSGDEPAAANDVMTCPSVVCHKHLSRRLRASASRHGRGEATWCGNRRRRMGARGVPVTDPHTAMQGQTTDEAPAKGLAQNHLR